MKIQKLSVVLGVLVSGCSAGPIYVKEGGSQEQFNADQFECEQKLVTMYGGYENMGLSRAFMVGGDVQRCMYLKGYRPLRSVNLQKTTTAGPTVTDARQSGY